MLADDPMLMVDVDEDIGSCDDEDPSNVTVNDLDDMKRTLESLQRQLQVKSEQLEAAVEDMDKMKRITQSLVDGPAAASTLEVERSVSGRRTENEDSNYAGSYGTLQPLFWILSSRLSILNSYYTCFHVVSINVVCFLKLLSSPFLKLI